MRRALVPLLLLAACAEFPTLDARIPAAERAAPPPPLQPLGSVLATSDAAPAAPAFAPALAQAAQDLAVRAQGVVGPAGAGAVAERLAALQARAEALRDGVLSEEERERLEPAASLP